jgi:hypothetical protein
MILLKLLKNIAALIAENVVIKDMDPAAALMIGLARENVAGMNGLKS